MTNETKAALLIVDVQKDFCPGGALAAPGGDRIIPALNRHIAEARARDMPVYASRDWHPPVTSHFAHATLECGRRVVENLQRRTGEQAAQHRLAAGAPPRETNEADGLAAFVHAVELDELVLVFVEGDERDLVPAPECA